MDQCNVCSSNNYKILFKEFHTYSICKECGHVFQSNRKPSTYYHELPYESQWNDYMNHSKNRANYIADFISSESLNTIKTVVDVGCGPGGVIYHMSQRFPTWNIHGITAPCDKEVMISGVKATYGDFEISTVNRKCDLVIMCHVLEHFTNPLNSLKKANSMLNEDSLIYIEVPSFHYAEIRSNPQFCPVHLSYFSKKKLRQLLECSGFELIKIKESRYWGNIKVLARKKSHIAKCNLKENYTIKLIQWEINKKIINNITKFVKKYKKINSND